jgi:hypothetical protein
MSTTTTSNAETQDRIINMHGAQYQLLGRAWWTNAALDKGDGRVEVARIEAASLTLRHPSAEQLDADPGLNRYSEDASNHGRLIQYMIGLTDDELAGLSITPGILAYPAVKDGPRPASNRTDKPVSMRSAQQAQDWVQNDCIGKPSDY